INIPLLRDQLALRINGYRDDMSGYIKNIVAGGTENASRTNQGRVALRWTPTEKLTVDASFTIDKVNGGLDYAEGALPVYVSARPVKSQTTLDMNIFSLGLKYDLGFADVTSTSSFVR